MVKVLRGEMPDTLQRIFEWMDQIVVSRKGKALHCVVGELDAAIEIRRLFEEIKSVKKG